MHWFHYYTLYEFGFLRFFFFLPWCLRKYILVYRRRNLCAYYIFAAFHLLLLNLSPDTGDKTQMILDSTETSFIHLKKKISYEVKKVAAWKSWKCSKYLPPIVIQTTNSTLLHFWTTAFARRHFFLIRSSFFSQPIEISVYFRQIVVPTQLTYIVALHRNDMKLQLRRLMYVHRTIR